MKYASAVQKNFSYLVVGIRNKQNPYVCDHWKYKILLRAGYAGWVKNEKYWSLSHAWLFAIPATVVHQAPLSMEFFR